MSATRPLPLCPKQRTWRCNDLHPAHISLLAQALKETHNKPGLFQKLGEFPTQTDIEFPMAEGALGLVFSLKSHLDDVRAHLGSSRTKLLGQGAKAA